MTFIEGERIDLRVIESEDTEFLRRAAEPAVRRNLTVQWTPTNDGDWEEYVENTASADDETVVTLLACRDAEPIGEVMLRPLRRRKSRAELGYWLVPEAWGEGYATEAAGLLLGYAFDELGLHRVSARVCEANEASQRVLEKLDFTREGVTRDGGLLDGDHVDVYKYGLLEGEWRS